MSVFPDQSTFSFRNLCTCPQKTFSVCLPAAQESACVKNIILKARSKFYKLQVTSTARNTTMSRMCDGEA